MTPTFNKIMGGLCAAGALCAMTACGGGRSFTIEGTTAPDLVGMLEPQDTVVYIVSFNNDTLGQGRLNSDGTFSIKGNIDRPSLSFVMFGEERVAYVVVEPGSIDITVGEESVIGGTPQNDALNEFFTLAGDLEQYYVQQMYSLADAYQSDSTATGDSLRMSTVGSVMGDYFAAMNNLTDSIYEENRQNEVGLYMCIMQVSAMHSSDEVRQRFGDNDYIMSSQLVQNWMDELDNPQEELYDEPNEPGDSTTEWGIGDDAAEQ